MAGTDLARWFLVVPGHQFQIEFVYIIEGLGERGGAFVDGVGVVEEGACLHGGVVVPVAAVSGLGGNLEDNPPGNWLAALADAALRGCKGSEKNKEEGK